MAGKVVPMQLVIHLELELKLVNISREIIIVNIELKRPRENPEHTKPFYYIFHTAKVKPFLWVNSIPPSYTPANLT